MKIINVNHLSKLKKKKNALDKTIHLKKKIIKLMKTRYVNKVLQKILYLMNLIKIKRISEICAENKHNNDPSCPNAFDDDFAVINQLDMDLFCLLIKVKFWEDEHDLVIPFTKRSEKKVAKDT